MLYMFLADSEIYIGEIPEQVVKDLIEDAKKPLPKNWHVGSSK